MTTSTTIFIHCRDCGIKLRKKKDRQVGICWDCREVAAINVRKSWCIVQEYGKGPYQLVTATAAHTTLKQTNQKQVRT